MSAPYFREQFELLHEDGSLNTQKSNAVSSNVVSVLQAGAFFGSLGSAPISGVYDVWNFECLPTAPFMTLDGLSAGREVAEAIMLLERHCHSTCLSHMGLLSWSRQDDRNHRPYGHALSMCGLLPTDLRHPAEIGRIRTLCVFTLLFTVGAVSFQLESNLS